jgi:carboxymethylenebutenolidase
MRTNNDAVELTPGERVLSDVWDQHVGAEFAAHDAGATLRTMVAHPRVNHVPVMTGGEGRAQIEAFYSGTFLRQVPPDMEMTPVSRTIGQGRVVDEMLVRFTHSIDMDWFLPGVPPTHKRLELALVVVVQFEGDKVKQENLYWDQASVLVQLGLLDRVGLPILGAESARSVVDKTLPLNRLMQRGTSAVRGA